MYGWKLTHRVAALLTVIAALAFLVGSAQAANSRPAGMTKAEYRALMLRSEALNEQYGLGSGTYKPAVDTHVTASPRPTVTVSQGGFAWGEFGLGAAAMLGLALVATGLAAGRRHLPRARVSS